MSKSDAKRLADLKAARRKTRKGQTITLMECAALWGVSKPRFVNKRNEIAAFPEPSGMDGNANLYPKRTAINAMIDYIEGHAKASKTRGKRLDGLTGADQSMSAETQPLPINDLLRANNLRADLQQAKVDQGELVKRQDVEAVASFIFSEISDFFSNLSNRLDPHGVLPARVRKSMDEMAQNLLMTLHGRLRKYLTDGPDKPPTRKRTKGFSRVKPRK